MHIHANISLAFHFLIRFIIKASSNEEEIQMPNAKRENVDKTTRAHAIIKW